MPTYEYACRACGQRLEVVQSFADDALTVCETCGGELRKVFSAAGLIFKGSGWHIKDDSSSASGSSSPSGSSSAPGSADTKGSSAASDAKPASSAPKSAPSSTSSGTSSGTSGTTSSGD